MKNRLTKAILLGLLSVTILASGAFYANTAAYADDNTQETDENGKKKKIEKIDDDTVFELDREVKDWVDGGGAIPAEAKYCTYSGSPHLWVLDDTDLSDGKIKLVGNNETEECIYLAGNRLTTWLRTQFFYGDKLGSKENRIKFKRPNKDKEF